MKISVAKYYSILVSIYVKKNKNKIKYGVRFQDFQKGPRCNTDIFNFGSNPRYYEIILNFK